MLGGRPGSPVGPGRGAYDHSVSPRAEWDERFSVADFVFGSAPNVFVPDLAAGLPPGRALDLGAGEGRHAVWLAQQGHQVTAVDWSPVGFAKGRSLAAAAGVEVDWVVADLAGWEPEPEAYDLVLLTYFQVVPDLRRRVHHQAVRALAPGGRLVLVAHHVDNISRGVGGPQDPGRCYNEATLRADFPGLEILRCEAVLRTVGAGTPEQAEAIDVILVGVRGMNGDERVGDEDAWEGTVGEGLASG